MGAKTTRMKELESKSKALSYIAKKNAFALTINPDSFNSRGDMIHRESSPGSPRTKTIADSRRKEGSESSLRKKSESKMQKLLRKRSVQHVDVTRKQPGNYFSQPGSKLQTPVRSTQISPKRDLKIRRKSTKINPLKRNSAVFHAEGNEFDDVQFTENTNWDGPFMKCEDWRTGNTVKEMKQMNLSYKLNRRKFRSTEVSVMKDNKTVLTPYFQPDSHNKALFHGTSKSINQMLGLASQWSFSNEASLDGKKAGTAYILKPKKQLNALVGLTKQDQPKPGPIVTKSRAEHAWLWKGKHKGRPSDNKSAFT